MVAALGQAGIVKALDGDWGGPGPSPGAFANDNGYYAGQQDASYDQNNGLAYNPVGNCLPCHSQEYWNNFHQGYDSVYQNQAQNTEQKSTNNIYINGNGNYVSTNTEQTSNQNQQQNQGPSGPGFGPSSAPCGFSCNGGGEGGPCGFDSCQGGGPCCGGEGGPCGWFGCGGGP